MKIFFAVISILLAFHSFSVNAAKVSGIISDSENSELLTGAYISLIDLKNENKIQTVSGLDGSYQFTNLLQGNYRIEISFLGYLDVSENIILENSSSNIIKNINLKYDQTTLGEVVVLSGARGTDSQARQLERDASSVLNVISAKQIQLSPDITVANVIQRVSGLSIERNASGDPQYAIVRGMDKRYNNTLINGIKIPSPDNENRYVPLDIFPAVFLERLEVYKSLTANMEADAIGGTVNMVMRSAPNELLIDSDIQIGYNQLNFNRPFGTYDRSNLNRKSPRELYGPTYRATPDDFPTENMTLKEVSPLPDIFANVTYGNRFLDKKLGLMVGASFQNSYRPVDNYIYDPQPSFAEGNPLLMRELIDRKVSSQMQRIAFHGKVDYLLNERNKFSLYYGKYLLNEFRVRDQVRRDNFVTLTGFSVYPISRFSNIFQDISTYDLRGDHQLFPSLNLNWKAIYSVAKNDRPDDGVFATTGTFDANSDQLIGEAVYFQGTRNSRAWERNQDNDLSLYLDLIFKPNFLNEQSDIKFGGLARRKDRDNYYNYYNYAQVIGQFRGEQWNDFSEVDFRAMANPLGSGDRSNLVYDAYEDIYAGYANANIQINRTNIQGGVRAEMTVQGYQINSTSAASNDTDLSQQQEYLNVFPSLSLKHKLNQKTNVRATYFKGISRPGFYEIVPTIRNAGGGDGFYSEMGNADLKPSIGHSADLRYEFFPSGVNQFLLGIFYKRILDPIEFGFPQVTSAESSPNTNRILPQNFDAATNFGIEMDYTKYFNKFGVRMNYTYTKSSITTNKIQNVPGGTRLLVSQTRPLQGQSDHVGNFSLLYKDQKKLIDVQTVLNYTGERIAFVSPFFGTDHYMKAMVQLDLSVEKGFSNGFICFIKANNILNTPYQLYVKRGLAVPEDPYPYQTDPYNQAFVRKDIYGQSYRVGLRYNFF